MKIGDIYTAPQQLTGGRVAEEQSSGARTRAALGERVTASDHSELSSVATLAHTTGYATEDRTARIAHFRAEFDAGRYEPDVTKLSRVLVQSALDSGI